MLAISLGTLVLLFVRGERRALGAQSADTALLVVVLGGTAVIAVLWGMFDRPGGGGIAVASGIEWGIVIALLAAIWLGWTGLSSYRNQRVAVPEGGLEARARVRAAPDSARAHGRRRAPRERALGRAVAPARGASGARRAPAAPR